jgi:hypothetical protein
MLNKSQNTKKQQINPLLTRATPFPSSLSLTRPKLARLDCRKFVGNMIGPPIFSFYIDVTIPCYILLWIRKLFISLYKLFS